MALTKVELMKMVLRQQESLNAQNDFLILLNEKVTLLEKQNELLWDYNNKLRLENQNR